MRALAEYIMRGRTQAALIAILLVPILPQATLALVTLRRGTLDGLWIMFWAFAPMIIAMWSDIEFVPMAMISLGTLIAVYTGAQLLRLQLNWPTVLMALIGVVFVLSLLFVWVFDQQITGFLQQLVELQKASLKSQGIAYDESLMVLPSNWHFVGLGSFGVIVNVTIALAIGRWWQALLYNPGGFRREFSQLRLNPLLAGGLVLIASLTMVSADYRYWSWLAAFPLVMVSVSLAHQFAALQRMGRAWLVIFYLALLSLPFYLVMAVLGFLDSWTNLRRRLLPGANQPQSKSDE
jgi:hypothetical protein